LRVGNLSCDRLDAIFVGALSGFAQRDDGVEVTVETLSAPEIKGSYLIGCDGRTLFVSEKRLGIAIRRLYASGTFPRFYDTVFLRSANFAMLPKLFFFLPG